MRGIFTRLLLYFSLTFILAGALSGVVLLSFSQHSVESLHKNFVRQLHSNIAHSIVLMGQAAYMMWEHWGDQVLEEYLNEVEISIRAKLFLSINDRILPNLPTQDPTLSRLAQRATEQDHCIIEVEDDALIVAQRLNTPEGAPYVVIGIHRLSSSPDASGPLLLPLDSISQSQQEDFVLQFGRLVEPLTDTSGKLSTMDFLVIFFKVQGLRLLGFLPVAGILCYVLARSFSTPVNRLRQASRLIADGDLSTRVGTRLGGRGDELNELGRDFDLMAERMEGLVNDQKRLLLDISHELRSPLTRLKLSLELTKKRYPEENVHLTRIGREVERMTSLIGQLLSLARSDVPVLDPDLPPVALAELVQEIGEDVDFEFRPHGKGVRVLRLENLVAAGSRELLRKGIENIVRNGAHYTRAGSQVGIALFSRTDESGQLLAVLRVRDYGPGVPEDKLPHLTEPFFRVAEARDRSSGGVGLGLAIANQTIHLHGGTLEFTNATDGNGLIVTVELPAVEMTLPHGESAAGTPSQGASPPTSFP